MTHSGRYPHLLNPARLGPKEARNRIWMTAHGTQLVRDNNFTDEHVAYYVERARGGVGVITMEAMAVHPTTQPYMGKVHAFDDRVVPSYQRLGAAVRAQGALVIGQLWHRGRQTDSIVSRRANWAPSSIPDPVYREQPHAMTLDDIEELTDGYVRSAELCVEGGLDGIEVHGAAHGYLLGQFLSPATNHRTDRYGGSFENRIRIIVDIVRAVRRVVPDDRVLGMRINGEDGALEGALHPQDWATIAAAVTDVVPLDYVSVSQGTYDDRMLIYPSTPQSHGYQTEATATVKRALGDVPVVVAGRIVRPEMAEAILARGDADFVGMTRQLIADPEWAEKAGRGEEDRIRPCVGANWCMTAITKAPLACVHNPAVGREKTLGRGTLGRSATTRRVAVVGGGPAGLRAALVARQRGHEVTLHEARSELGGQVAWLARVEAYREFAGIVDWLADEVARAGVEVLLDHRVDPDDLADADTVVVATGATPLRHGWSVRHPARWSGDTTVPGCDQWNVFTSEDILADGVDVPRSVVVFDDVGDRRALAVAEYLADEGHPVRIVTPMGTVGTKLAASRDQGRVLGRLRRKGVVFSTFRDLDYLDGDTLTLTDVHTGDTERLEGVDALVLETGARAERTVVDALGERAVEHVAIGDCVAPRRIFDAMWEAEQAARAL